MERLWEKNIWPDLDPKVPEIKKRPIFEELRSQAVQRPDKTALIFYGKKISYGELDELSDRFASSLLELGVKKGERVGIFLENCPQFVIGFYGILKMGGVVVNISPMHKSAELEHELRDAGITTILLEDPFYPVLSGVDKYVRPGNIIVTSFSDFLPEEPEIVLHESISTKKVVPHGAIDFMTLIDSPKGRLPSLSINLEEDVALLQYTAGTTGSPKGAMLTHQNLAVHGKIVRHYYEYQESDVHLVVLPLFHVTGLDIAMNPALAMGSTLILFARFDLMPILNAIPAYGVTHWVTITPINVAVSSIPGIEKHDFSSLKLVLSGGAPVPVEVHEKWKDITGTDIVEGYGLSECTGGICGNNGRNFSPGTVGGPVYFHDVQIRDIETDKPVEEGKSGELMIKGPCVMKGYWNRPDDSKDAITVDGWLRTGDIATMDAEGWLRIVGRSKEMIKVSGYSVFLAEIDACLYNHPAVMEAATVGAAHPYRGEEPVSFVVLAPDFDGSVCEDDIVGFCKERMAAYKYPRRVKFVETLPKSGAGKILRRKLVDRV